jgi:hypothetical protein
MMAMEAKRRLMRLFLLRRRAVVVTVSALCR